MNHWASNHWASNHWRSNHFAGQAAAPAPPPRLAPAAAAGGGNSLRQARPFDPGPATDDAEDDDAILLALMPRRP